MQKNVYTRNIDFSVGIYVSVQKTVTKPWRRGVGR
jgi:hypothetical protein